MSELNIDILCANSSQAKGRVERAHLTLPDRLVKELRSRGISRIDIANRWLPTFQADYNRRFAREPRSAHNAHRPLAPHEMLQDVFHCKVERKLSLNLTLNYKRTLYLVEPDDFTNTLRGKRVEGKHNSRLCRHDALNERAPLDRHQSPDIFTWGLASTAPGCARRDLGK